MKIITTKDYKDMSRQAANIVSAQIILEPKSVIGLATGKTPLGIYGTLIDWYNKNDIDFSDVRTVNLDEYCGLAPNDEHSYRYFMNRNFFDKINIKKENTYVPDGLASDFDLECQRYDELIDSLGGIDLQLLGIGHNGHIGFNEPGMAFEKMTHCVELTERTIQANSKYFESAEAMPRKALTMGIKSTMLAKKILLVADGEDKKDILRTALFGPVTPRVPASILQLHPCLTVVASFNVTD